MTGCGESVVRIGGFCFDGLFIGAICWVLLVIALQVS